MRRLVDAPVEFCNFCIAQIQANPTIVAATVTQFVVLGKVFGVLSITEAQHDTLISAVAGLSSLWLRNQVIPNVFRAREVQKAVLHREATGTGLGGFNDQ